MRSAVIIAVVFVSSLAWGQNWRDSLSAAHSAYAEGNYNEAHEKFISAQQLAPEGVDLSKDIGTSAYRKGDYESAEKAFSSAVNKSESPADRARKWHNIGNAQMKQKNYSKAVDSYKQALRENPADENTRYNLSEAKRRLQKEKEEQQKEQNNQENQDNQDKQDQQGQSDQNQQNNQNSSGQSNQQNSQNQQDSQKNNGQNGQSSSSEEQKLSSKKTERMLDELMKKEMETKRRVHGLGTGGKDEQVKSGKRW